MSPTDQPRCASKSPRYEALEDRLVLSAQPLGTFLIDPADHESLTTQYDEVAPALTTFSVNGQLTALQQQYGFTGAGQTVAVIDTGIAYDHYALGGGLGAGHRVVGGWDFAENDADPYDDGPIGFHGSHVSGIIGSSDDTHRGVAPGVDFVALRVFDDVGQGSFTWVEQALQWVHDHQNDFANPITTVNLSLGTNWNSHDVPDWAILEDELKLLNEDGIFVSVAAGNSFQQFHAPGLSYPASSPFVVPVASHDDAGQLSDFSQRSDRVLAAPGERITSTVPDHLYGSSAPSHRFMTASGTSMAAPYVAGASTLVREAMDFLGYQEIDQQRILDHLLATSDEIYDSITRSNYQQINLANALDALMADDFGDSINDAHALGELQESMTWEGSITRRNDQDLFSFDASSDGRVTLDWTQSHDLDAQWRLNGEVLVPQDGKLTFEVEAGKSYHLDLTSLDGIGHYEVSTTFEAVRQEEVWLELGAASDHFLDEIELRSSLWIRGEAVRDGFVTWSLAGDSGEPVEIDLYDSEGRLLASSTDGRVEAVFSRGESYQLRLRGNADSLSLQGTNRVHFDNGALSIYGTSDGDHFDIKLGSDIQVTLGSVAYEFSGSEVNDVKLFGGGGSDRLTLTGTDGHESIRLSANSAQYQSSQLRLTSQNIESVRFDGQGGQDRAYFYGTDGDDVFTASPTKATMRGDGFENVVTDIEDVYAYSTSGNDRAVLEGSSLSDRIFVRSAYSAVTSSATSRYVFGFSNLEVDATQGGHDQVTVFDSEFDDELRIGAGSLHFENESFKASVAGVRNVLAQGGTGGNDHVVLEGTAGSDVFYARPSDTSLSGSGYRLTTRNFAQVIAESGGGIDRAYLFDSRGNDRFEVDGNGARLIGDEFSNEAKGFSAVYAIARSGGNDQAVLQGTAANETFYANNRFAYMRQGAAMNLAYGFSYVTANGGGGYDTALLNGTAGNDRAEVRADSVKLSGTGYELSAESFANVRVDGRGGADEVVFFELGDREPSRRGTALEADYDGQNVQLNQFLYYQVQAQLNLDGDQESTAADHVFGSLSTDS